LAVEVATVALLIAFNRGVATLRLVGTTAEIEGAVRIAGNAAATEAEGVAGLAGKVGPVAGLTKIE
jgi:hypothetical protein